MALNDVPYGDKTPELVNVIIEIPRGSGNKYEFDKDLGVFMLDRVQPTTMKQPYDYGFVPKTLSDDGDPIDALVVVDEALFPGVVVNARVVGMLKMIDDGETDEKLICVADDDKSYRHVESLDDLGPHFQDKVRHYFERYKDLQKKHVEITGWGTKGEAYEAMKAAIDNYQKQ